MMCLAVPATVLSIEGQKATVEISGVRYQANLSLVEDVAIGDAVLLHAGFAIQKLDPEAAAETLALFEELEEFNRQQGLEDPDPAVRTDE